jgi:hypothetical protein
MKKVLLIIGLVVALTAVMPLTWADPPEMSGPFVIRFSGTFATFWVDDDLPQLMVIGADLNEFCAKKQIIRFSTFESLDVFVPQQDGTVVDVFTMDDALAGVWPIIGAPNNVCEAWANAGGVPLASGTVDVTGTDNDLFASDEERWNAFTIRANGVLVTPAGNLVRVTSGFQCVWDGENDETFRCNEKAKLH